MLGRAHLLFLGLVGCRIGFDELGVAASGQCGVVTPTYPLHAGWGDYVAQSDGALDRDHQPDITCAGTEVGGTQACLHGGERRTLVLDGVTSCSGVSAIDELGAFEWRCHEDSGAVVVSTTGLARDHGLASLVTAGGWRSNRVTVTTASDRLCSSTDDVWWDTQVLPLPANAGTGVAMLANPGVYVLDASRSTDGYAIAADHVSVVVLDGATLTYDSGATPNCNSMTGLTAAPDGHCVITSGGSRFLWLEGHVEGAPVATALRAVLMRDTAFSRLHRMDVRSTRTAGIDISDALGTTLSDIDEQGCTLGHGISLERFAFGQLRGIRAANNGGYGIYARGDFGVTSLQTTAFTTFSDIVVASNGGEGLGLVCGASRNILAGVLAVGNGDCGVYSVCNNGSLFTHITALNNVNHGLRIDSGGDHRVTQVVAAANGLDGFHLEQSSSNLGITSLLSTNNGQFGVVIEAGNTGNWFDGFLAVGNNAGADCRVSGTTSPGLVDTTCSATGADGSTGYGTQASSAVLRTGRTVATAFAGKLTTDDPASPFDIAGTAASVTDWWALTGRSRAWGRDGNAFPDPTNRGPCSSNCRLWDWQPTPGGAVSARSGDGNAENDAFVTGTACPAAVDGNAIARAALARETLGDGVGDDDGYCESSESCDALETYLVNAIELLADDAGNEDGLCESGERCVYVPDVGGIPRGRNLIGPCLFASGVITDVQMYSAQ